MTNAELGMVDFRLEVKWVTLQQINYTMNIDSCVHFYYTSCALWSFSSKVWSVPLGNLLSSSSNDNTPSFLSKKLLYNVHLHYIGYTYVHIVRKVWPKCTSYYGYYIYSNTGIINLTNLLGLACLSSQIRKLHLCIWILTTMKGKWFMYTGIYVRTCVCMLNTWIICYITYIHKGRLYLLYEIKTFRIVNPVNIRPVNPFPTNDTLLNDWNNF